MNTTLGIADQGQGYYNTCKFNHIYFPSFKRIYFPHYQQMALIARCF